MYKTCSKPTQEHQMCCMTKSSFKPRSWCVNVVTLRSSLMSYTWMALRPTKANSRHALRAMSLTSETSGCRKMLQYTGSTSPAGEIEQKVGQKYSTMAGFSCYNEL